MDFAYKCLEGTEKYCDLHNRKFNLFSSNSSNATMADKLTDHEKLYRRTIIADCILFEAVLVFLKQGLTSYVKGGYLMRKAWKMYEKIYQDTEKLCTMPSPITKAGVSSPMDKHIGRSMYDECNDDRKEDAIEEEVGNEGRLSPDDDDGVAEVSDGLAAMHVGLSMLGGGPVKLEFGEDDDSDEEEEECRQLNQTDDRKKGGAPGMISVGIEDHPLSVGNKLQLRPAPMKSRSAVNGQASPKLDGGRTASEGVISANKVQPGIDVMPRSHSHNDQHSMVISTDIQTQLGRNLRVKPTSVYMYT